MHRGSGWGYCLVILLVTLGCREKKTEPTLFELLPSGTTGIDFANNLTPTESFNAYTYRNFYNGGGVAVGDINNDGLPDLFFAGNQVGNRLYLNKGQFQFEDITATAGVASQQVWSTGITMADVNGDGWLDIYVCKSGSPEGENRENSLYINNGDLTFRDEAAAYGLNIKGLSTHACFFDFDRDNDLDCYLLTNSFRSVGNYDLRKDQRLIPDSLGGNRLLRNDAGKFHDISREAGIYSSAIGFGLGVAIADLNLDGWPDMYVSNDFFERDYLYLNNQKGGFTESLESMISELSMGSMGADIADLNNDLTPEIFVTEMLPQQLARQKTKAVFENWAKHQANAAAGYYYQYPRNVLQLNQGGVFSEIGRYAGVYATDWSWGALAADFDNDGHKDIFVANGIYKDLLDQDYVNYMADPATIRRILAREKKVLLKLFEMIPSTPLPNYLYRNNGDLTFTDQAMAWGLATPSFSNGSAYGDLDGDGDLDLVVNNVNMPAFVYNNHTSADTAHFLRLALRGRGKNVFGVGARVIVYSAGTGRTAELHPARGFESSVEPVLHVGLGKTTQIDSVRIFWPDGFTSLSGKLPLNTRVMVHEDSVNLTPIQLKEPILVENEALPVVHHENEFNEFDRERLLFHMTSTEGPALAVADVNGDGLDDFYLGGAKDQAGQLALQTRQGTFSVKIQAAFEADAASEDTDAVFFDADNDGDVDLYVTSGGSELPASSTALIDRLYINNGKGIFTKSNQILPVTQFESSGCVTAADLDSDGDQDLVVGIRQVPFYYGVPASVYLLINDGKGNFTNLTPQQAPGLANLGMIRDVAVLDANQDGLNDLLVAGDWLGIRLFQQESNRTFKEVSPSAGFLHTEGWWNCLLTTDIDNDGDTDILAGNHGLNSRFKATVQAPVRLHYNDFDRNGSPEHLIEIFEGESPFPLAQRNDLVSQMPILKKRYLKYSAYQSSTLTEMFGDSLKGGYSHQVVMLESAMWLNDGKGNFTLQALPQELQLFPVYALEITDWNRDGRKDIVAIGNFSASKPEVGRYMGGFGLVLVQEESTKLSFRTLNSRQSRLYVRGEGRKLSRITVGGKPRILIGVNNGPVRLY